MFNMFKRIWKFLLVENHRKALGIIGGVIVATATAIWAVFLYIAPPSSPRSNLATIPVKSGTPTSPGATQSPPLKAPHAEAEDGGIAVVATDKAKVNINQTIRSNDRSQIKKMKPHTGPSLPGGPSSRSGEQGVSVTAAGSSDVKVRQEVD